MVCRLVVVFLFVTLPDLAAAQSSHQRRFALSGGVVFEAGDEEVETGVRVGSALTLVSRPNRAMRLDASYQIFGRGAYATIGCGGSIPCPTGEALRVLQLGVTLAFFDSNGMAFTAGTGLYDMLETPFDGSYVAPGWSIGFYAPIGRAGFLELGWHGIVGPGATAGLVPFSLGLRF